VERRDLRLPAELADGRQPVPEIQDDGRPASGRWIFRRLAARDGEPRVIRHCINETKPLRPGGTAARRHGGIARHTLAAERERAELRRHTADAARLDQRSTQLGERIEETVCVASESCDRTIARADAAGHVGDLTTIGRRLQRGDPRDDPVDHRADCRRRTTRRLPGAAE